MKYDSSKWKLFSGETYGRVKMANEFYFQTYLTENEHYIVEDMFRKFCDANGLTLVYYRQLKQWHIPCIREVKVRGENLEVFKQYLKEEKPSIIFNIYQNELALKNPEPNCFRKERGDYTSCNRCFERRICPIRWEIEF